jgi:hypothetical protein
VTTVPQVAAGTTIMPANAEMNEANMNEAH